MSDHTRDLLAELRQRCDAATPGPWWWDQRGDLRPTPHDEYGLDCIIGWDAIEENPVLSDGDAAFIAASRTIVPRLIAAVEAVLAEHPAARLGCITHYARTDCECETRFTCATCAVTHPCPTVTAVEAALRGEP